MEEAGAGGGDDERAHPDDHTQRHHEQPAHRGVGDGGPERTQPEPSIDEEGGAEAESQRRDEKGDGERVQAGRLSGAQTAPVMPGTG
jgi:hypothetical protein